MLKRSSRPPAWPLSSSRRCIRGYRDVIVFGRKEVFDLKPEYMRPTGDQERMKQAKLEWLVSHVDEWFELDWTAEDVVRLPVESLEGEWGRRLQLGHQERGSGLVTDAASVGQCHPNAHTPNGSGYGRVWDQLKHISTHKWTKLQTWCLSMLEWAMKLL